MTWSPPSKVGDIDPAIAVAKSKLKGFSYGKAEGLGTTDTSQVYTEGFGRALPTFQNNRNAEIDKGTKPAPKMSAIGTLDWATKSQLGMLAAVPTPAPAKLRHPAFAFRGTGGIIGQDYVSRICQQCDDLVEEINTPWAATMGGLPVGTAGSVTDPSMWRAVREGLAAAKAEFLKRFALNRKVRIVIIGYSAGAVLAALFRQWILENYPDNYLCSVSLGDPTRPNGGAFYNAPGANRDGQGISSWHYGDVNDWRHCWLTNVSDPARPDMYARIALGKTGEIMMDAFDMVTHVELGNPVATAQNLVTVIPEIAADAGIAVPDALGALSNGIPGLLAWGLPLLGGALGGLIGGGNPDTLTGTAAAAKAAQIGLTFALDNPPTKPHITYEFAEVWPGMTYLQLGVQHVRDWASRVAPVAA
ncbi:hypothetical protein [Mycolicibacterium sphagni]|uniref:Lysin B n=1 Tax=Mycolicibacterium sphagni TaxID=1786 RepID=A0A255DLU2_9MYCO|nr:hypothetical protein [Mycolicibacterium sphagni]OYN80409.1 hypothetical protein CG716_09765 [Mycolicibacterium sphagni]